MLSANKADSTIILHIKINYYNTYTCIKIMLPILLPMGKFLDGVHDHRLVQQSFGKELHAIRESNINHKVHSCSM